MNEGEEKVGHLKKVDLLIEAGRTPETLDLISKPISLSFVFGIGQRGLTPLEFELIDRKVGDALTLKVKPGQLMGIFGHLYVHLLEFPEDIQTIYLRVRLERISAADQREVIKALADLSGCGGHCCGH
jgi:hypothetical protein